jgi:hypothetical protein
VLEPDKLVVIWLEVSIALVLLMTVPALTVHLSGAMSFPVAFYKSAHNSPGLPLAGPQVLDLAWCLVLLTLGGDSLMSP